jgi:hypothetical protein
MVLINDEKDEEDDEKDLTNKEKTNKLNHVEMNGGYDHYYDYEYNIGELG